jgi:hypothetical protein
VPSPKMEGTGAASVLSIWDSLVQSSIMARKKLRLLKRVPPVCKGCFAQFKSIFTGAVAAEAEIRETRNVIDWRVLGRKFSVSESLSIESLGLEESLSTHRCSLVTCQLSEPRGGNGLAHQDFRLSGVLPLMAAERRANVGRQSRDPSKTGGQRADVTSTARIRDTIIDGFCGRCGCTSRAGGGGRAKILEQAHEAEYGEHQYAGRGPR